MLAYVVIDREYPPPPPPPHCGRGPDSSKRLPIPYPRPPENLSASSSHLVQLSTTRLFITLALTSSLFRSCPKAWKLLAKQVLKPEQAQTSLLWKEPRTSKPMNIVWIWKRWRPWPRKGVVCFQCHVTLSHENVATKDSRKFPLNILLVIFVPCISKCRLHPSLYIMSFLHEPVPKHR